MRRKQKHIQDFVQRLAGQVSRKLEILGINDGWFTGKVKPNFGKFSISCFSYEGNVLTQLKNSSFLFQNLLSLL